MTVSSSPTVDGSFNPLSHELLNKYHAIHPLSIKHNEDDTSTLSEWPSDVDAMLESIRCNSIILSDYHKTKYFFLQSRLKYFRIPVIIISAFASVFNIGLQPWMDQAYISVICCMMSLVTGLIGSIELFLQVQKKMESDLLYSRDFYLLAIDIYKVLSLEPKNRHGDGISYLDEKFNVYRKMVENSNILDKSIMDQLAPIDIKSLKNPVHRTTAMSLFDTMSTKNDGEEVAAKPVQNFHHGLASFFKLNHSSIHHHHHGVGVGVGVGSNVGKTGGVIKASDEDRFQLYCDLVKRSEEFEPMITDILCHLLVAHQSNEPYDLSLEDRMKIYCYFAEQADKFNDDMFPAKLKSILVEDFFTKKSAVKFAPNHVTTESHDPPGGNDEGEKTGGTTRLDRKLFHNFHQWVNPTKTEERVVTNSVVTDYDLEVGEKGEPETKTGATEGEDTALILAPLQEVSKTKVVSKYSQFVESAPSLYSKNIPKDDVIFKKDMVVKEK